MKPHKKNKKVRPSSKMTTPGSRRQARRPLARFATKFLISILLFYVLIGTGNVRQTLLPEYFHVNARISAAALRVFGQDALASGSSVFSPEFTVNIKRGCDALDPSALFMSAVLASPVSAWAKIPGVFSGLLLLFALNIVRIVSLFLVGIHVPRIFETMHVAVWQPLFLVFAVVCWLAWARWALRIAKAPPATSLA